MKPVKEITITRTFDAPRQLVFEAWLDEKHLQQWWMPRGFTNPTCRITSSSRPGYAETGAELTVVTYHPAFGDMPQTGKFEEVSPFDKIIFSTAAFLNSEGKPQLRGRNVIVFTDEPATNESNNKARTRMVITASILEAGPGLEGALAGMDQGWAETLDRLNEHVEDTSDREMSITRVVDAPRDLVWKIWTEPDHIKEWWGPNGFKNTIHKYDLVPGGEWVLTMHGPDGTDYPNHIRFVEIIPQQRLIYDHGRPPAIHGSADSGASMPYDQPEDGGSFRTFVHFIEEGDKTRVSMRGVFKTVEYRQMVIEKYGALEGQNQHIARMEAYLTKLHK